ncbi:MAG: 4-hydroxy-tetrahydrodipicolinate reductase [Thermoleophilia bacterium]|nr:4-hydroxy-tetrahydrodipicolinate reductase [Thermoleophilia bacterium]
MSEPVRRRVAVSGALGNMGRTVCAAVAAAGDLELAALVDPAFAGGVTSDFELPAYPSLLDALQVGGLDVVVDFTRPEAALGNILACVTAGVAVVMGTTGLQPTDLDEVRRAAEERGVAVFVAPNFALGAVLMMLLAEQAARHLDACEIVELHHDRKLDAPSGTAARTGAIIEAAWESKGLRRQVPIHSVRLPGLVAHQEVIFGALGQALTIRHDSMSRESFMPGVLLAIRSIDRLQGLTVGLENIL